MDGHTGGVAPRCGTYRAQKSRLSALIADERTAISSGRTGAVERYLTKFSGSKFERLVDQGVPNSITAKDLVALKVLNVGVSPASKTRILGARSSEISNLLKGIPRGLTLEKVRPEAFSRTLGPTSPAWQLWEVLYDALAGQPTRQGRTVTAGKLIYGKRPRLLPLYDTEIRLSYRVSNDNVWEAYWCFLQDQQIRRSLIEIRRNSLHDNHLSLIRVIDILGWMRRM
jgi:hypothetical protein